ncbi:uracil-DNA glycosylase family protein [Sphingomicrobium sp. XHP0235]|uniref:uracil-DNA glycosylase family protein n=1 Tax=Sphingomicrobium aquimarinum TaxID=3133971 RepID=UPI0031FF4198
MNIQLSQLVEQVRGCNHCAASLPFGSRPVVQVSSTAKLLIASQAPGSKVHASGIPFNDASGDRLRDWTGLSKDQFYDMDRVAILPMAFCYPGRAAGGDAPPRTECAPLWRKRLLALMPSIQLTLLVGGYAHQAELGSGKVHDRVRGYRNYLPHYFPLPHPSWRSQIWMNNNPWFEREVLPELQTRVAVLAE